MTTEIKVFWDMARFIYVDDTVSHKPAAYIFNVESLLKDGSSGFLRSLGICLRNFTTSHATG